MDFGRIQPQSNRATLQRQVMLFDRETGEPLDLTGKTIVVEVAANSDYCDYSGYGSDYHSDGRALLSATTDNGKITIVDLGVFEVRFERSEMTSLGPGTYNVGGTISDDDDTRQFLIDTIAIRAGVVAR